MKNKKGFTLIELIMVIVILGIIAALAIPNYFNLRNNALDAAEQGVVGGVRAGISTLHANNVANNIVPNYPLNLDGGAVSVTCITLACFTTVLGQGGVTAAEWARGGVVRTYIHTGTNTSTWTYDNTTGAFTCTATCP